MSRQRATRIAVAQPRMHWTTERNVEDILRALNVAADQRADICVLPELALTGFHREIAKLAVPAHVSLQVERIAEECRRLGIAAAFGAPDFDADRIFNAFHLIDHRGKCVASIRKNGLTPSEATFFQAGVGRPVAALRGLRYSAVLCREVEDVDDVSRQLPPGAVDLVFWPSLIGPDPEKPPQDPPLHVVQAQGIAKSLGAFVIQSNWPNALNDPRRSANTGHSAVISDAGELLFRLPVEASGVGVFNLGEQSFSWTPMH